MVQLVSTLLATSSCLERKRALALSDMRPSQSNGRCMRTQRPGMPALTLEGDELCVRCSWLECLGCLTLILRAAR